MFFLFMDEAFSVHEIANGPRFRHLWPDGNGYFHFAWVFPYLFLVFVVGMFFIRFLFRLPAATRNQYVIAGCMYVAGALGLELIGGKYKDMHSADLGYYLIITVEELMEMLAMIIFLNGTLRYYMAFQEKSELQLRFTLTADSVRNR